MRIRDRNIIETIELLNATIDANIYIQLLTRRARMNNYHRNPAFFYK